MKFSKTPCQQVRGLAIVGVMKKKGTVMKTLKQVNAMYLTTGYSVSRNAKGGVDVRFEGTTVWTILKGRTVAQVLETMSDMPWLAWGINSCGLPVIESEEELVELTQPHLALTVRERAALAAQANQEAELQRQSDLLYTDDQFRRNGYGQYDSCPLPDVAMVETIIVEPESVITIRLGDGWSMTTNHRGHCVEFDGCALDVVPNSAVARRNINEGVYLNPGECCPVCYSCSPIDQFGYQELVCHSDSDATKVIKPLPEGSTSEDRLMYYMGYPIEECWVDGFDVYTLDGDEYIGTINEYYKPQSHSYLTEAEYQRDKHLMVF